MLRLCSEIIINSEKSWRLTAVEECVISEDTDMLTDTCELTLPRNVRWQGIRDLTRIPIKRGDKMTVRLAYNDNPKVRFIGFIRSIDRQNPLKIKCEDAMFLLKQTKAEPKTFRNAKLKELISFLLKDTDIEFKLIDEDITVGNWRITKSNVAEELAELKSKMMLSAYFRLIDNKSILYVGLKYPVDNISKLKFIYSKNIISDNIEYAGEDSAKVKIKAQSFVGRKKQAEVECGDDDGELVEIRLDGLTKKELELFAHNAYEKHTKNKIKGSFETFGEPIARKCDCIDLTTVVGNLGVFWIKKNEISFNTSGYRQNIELN